MRLPDDRRPFDGEWMAIAPSPQLSGRITVIDGKFKVHDYSFSVNVNSSPVSVVSEDGQAILTLTDQSLRTIQWATAGSFRSNGKSHNIRWDRILFPPVITADDLSSEILWPESWEALWKVRLLNPTLIESSTAAALQSSAMFRHQTEAQPIVYGGWFGNMRAPVAFLEAPCRDLTEYLREDPEGPFHGMPRWSNPPLGVDPKLFALEVRGLTAWGFSVDEGLLKADWHAVPSSKDTATIFVPRLAAIENVRGAPPRIAAFVEAFRAVNRELWSIMHDSAAVLLKSLAGPVDSDIGKILQKFLSCFHEHNHFGAIEAQVWWGDEKRRLRSHVDGSTSMLHLGVTLQGNRMVRCGVFPNHDSGSLGGRSDSRSERDVWNEQVWRPQHLRDIAMDKGSVYLSSPTCFEHAVEFDRCSPQEASISLMLRFGFTGDVGPLVNWQRNDEFCYFMKIVAGALKVACDEGKIYMPSIEQVQIAEARIKKEVQVRKRLQAMRNRS